MTQTLKDLKAKADQASDAFDAVCRKHFVSRWDYYHVCACKLSIVPAECHRAADAYVAAQHAFYEARDGSKGFLGGKGL